MPYDACGLDCTLKRHWINSRASLPTTSQSLNCVIRRHAAAGHPGGPPRNRWSCHRVLGLARHGLEAPTRIPAEAGAPGGPHHLGAGAESARVTARAHSHPHSPPPTCRLEPAAANSRRLSAPSSPTTGRPPCFARTHFTGVPAEVSRGPYFQCGTTRFSRGRI